jgi:AraC-like DNA-binding protein
MSSVLMDTADLAEAETVLSLNFAKMRLLSSTTEAPARMRIERSYVGSIGVDSATYGRSLGFAMDPPERILLCRVLEGGVEYGTNDRKSVHLSRGQVGVIGPPHERPIAGRLLRGRYEHLIIEPRLLHDQLGHLPESEDAIRLLGVTPFAPAASQRLAALISYVKWFAAAEPVDENPLLAATLERHVAAVLLAALPMEAQQEPATGARRDGTPALMRRVEAYIEEHADDDISLADIAGVIYVNPRTLQYMFRKHRDCTPMEYVRRVRLHHAHLDLVAGDRMRVTVGQVAARWGFAHLGRFAIYYREEYGQSPHVTLRE